jgi:hypothetical protein
MKRKLVWAVAIFMVLTIFPNIAHSAERAAADIKPSDYPYVAALARASILADQPIAPTTQKIVYQFESGVPIENQKEIKEGGDNFLSRFGNILNYSGTAITVIAFSTSLGGLTLLRDFGPLGAIKVPEDFFLNAKGGISVGDKRLVVIAAPYVESSEPYLPKSMQLLTHELMHEVQASINKGTSMCQPVWLCEGGAQIMSAAMSVYQGKDTWAGGREHFSHIQDNRTLADLKIMEGYGSGSAPYGTGAILSEYLIAWGGFSNSLLVNQISYKTQNPDTMSGFRQAFQIVYGQSLDDFYIHALPYINYVAANWKSTSATSPEAVAFIIDRLGAVKAAEVVAAAATKAAADKAATDLKANQEAEAKAAADKVAADLKAKQEAEARAAAVKKKTTITCVKGKLTKKVTAVKPFCPAGFKKK